MHVAIASMVNCGAMGVCSEDSVYITTVAVFVPPDMHAGGNASITIGVVFIPPSSQFYGHQWCTWSSHCRAMGVCGRDNMSTTNAVVLVYLMKPMTILFKVIAPLTFLHTIGPWIVDTFVKFI